MAAWLEVAGKEEEKEEEEGTKKHTERIRMAAVMGDAQHEACFLSLEEDEREGERETGEGEEKWLLERREKSI